MRLLFITPDSNEPIGGIKVIYKHVDILNNHSDIEAYVYHSNPSFRATWFENTTRMFEGPILSTDILVVPEIYANQVNTIPNKRIIFNQNVHNTFNEANEDCYTKDNVLGAIVVSKHNRDYLEFAYPELDVQRVILSIDDSLFNANIPWNDREKIITAMPRRNANELYQVIHLISKSSHLNGYKFELLENLSEELVAKSLNKSRFFLSFGYPEGFPAPPREAIMSGNYVIGYLGFGGQELSLFCHQIPDGDVLQFAQFLANQLRYDNISSNFVNEQRKLFLSKYSFEREVQSVVNVYTKFKAKL
jgi:hypothetical protein